MPRRSRRTGMRRNARPRLYHLIAWNCRVYVAKLGGVGAGYGAINSSNLLHRLGQPCVSHPSLRAQVLVVDAELLFFVILKDSILPILDIRLLRTASPES